MEIKDRRYRLRSYKASFVGSEAVAYMMRSGMTSCVEDAVQLGNALIEAGLVAHVTRDHDFQDSYLFYRFVADEDHGAAGQSSIRLFGWIRFHPP